MPFLAGPERLVSSLAVAQALGRRHTGVLRELDVLVAERVDLLGRHVRFATYLHENRRPYRCFHLDRVGFEALMRRLPSADGRTVALRDATLAAFGPPAVEAPPDPAPTAAPAAARRPAPVASFVPRLDQDGFAVMRLDGEVMLVDMGRYDPAAVDRAVRLHPDGTITVGAVETRSGARSGDLRAHAETPPRPVPGRGNSTVQDTVRVVGAVIASQPAASPDREPEARPHPVRTPRPSGALPAGMPRADLAAIEVCGRA